MIHTSNIIDGSTRAWGRLVGSFIHGVEVFSLSELDEPAEIVFTTLPDDLRLHISWMQEDGANDNCLFYWLSMRPTSHFNGVSLVPFQINTPHMASIVNARITSIKLYGRSDIDAVYASLLQTDATTFAMATTQWLPNKQKFSRFGTDALAVLDTSALQSCVVNQGLELVVELE